MLNLKALLSLLLFFVIAIKCTSQSTIPTGANTYKTVAAGKEYKKSAWHRFWWGSNYRNVWATPVKVPVLMLDTAKGGLKVTKEGGGHQTKSLHLKNKDDKEYALRSVNKTLSAVLPQDFKGTFVEKLVNDEVSMSNPYGAAVVPLLAQAAKVYHTKPEFVYLPKQPLLDTFNNKFGNKLYLLEQRLDGDWSNADNLGNFNKFYSTDDVLKKILNDGSYKIDQPAFIRARIFDWFINDWDRHEDQWSWAEKKEDKKVFVPVPQDRDQAFFKHDGLLLNAGIAAGLPYMQSFVKNLKNIKTFTFEERNLDRFFTNETTLDEWQNIAKDLQQSITDAVIDEAVNQLPPEVYKVCGNQIDNNLKARKQHLVEWATAYYNFISKQVQVAGSNQNEQFNVERINEKETLVKVFALNNAYQKKDSVLYQRTFNSDQTNEIRLYGVDGNDIYKINGKPNNIKLKIISGYKKDSIINTTGKKVKVYNNENHVTDAALTKLHLSNDSIYHKFDYNWFKYDKSGFMPSIFYSFDDRIYVGLGYQLLHNAWRKEPFASKQLFDVHYSLSQKAFSYTYSALFPKLIGKKTDLFLYANYDAERWLRFWGLGNETQFVPKDIDYFTGRYQQWIFKPSAVCNFGSGIFTFSLFAQGIKFINDTSKFISKNSISNTSDYKWKTYVGNELNYTLRKLNDSIVPTKGVFISADATSMGNINERHQYFSKFSGSAQFYIPLVSNFSYVLRTGAATITGKPEFYQYNSIGGAPNLRGFRRDRFWGKTVFWNMNDLRYISNIKTYLFRGKAGVIAFFDDGRVWIPNENSNTWHTDFGGGITVAPLNKILVDVTYGISNNDKLFQVRINKFF